MARVRATCSSSRVGSNLLRPQRRQSMHVLRDGHGSASALHPGHMLDVHVCACDGQGTMCASHPGRMLCVHVCASRRTRHCVCFASGTRALRALGGKRKRLSVRAVCASQHAPLCACSLFLLELRDLTLLSLSPKSCGRELHSQLCPHIMVCMDVRSKLPNHWIANLLSPRRADRRHRRARHAWTFLRPTARRGERILGSCTCRVQQLSCMHA